MTTVALLAGWTLWLVVTLVLLALSGKPLAAMSGMLAAVFMILAVVCWAQTDVTWRAYLIAWLILHIALSAAAGYRGRSPGLYVLTLGSVVGLVWLWIQGGTQYWPYVLIGIAGVSIGAGAFWFVRRERRARPNSAEWHRPPAAPPDRPHLVLPPSVLVEGFRPSTPTPESFPARPEAASAPDEPADPPPNSSEAIAMPVGLSDDVADGDSVRVVGLARQYPAGAIHGSTPLTGQTVCPLADAEHVHVHRVSASLEPFLIEGSAALAACQALQRDYADPEALTRFRHAVRPVPPADPGVAPDTPLLVRDVTCSRTGLPAHSRQPANVVLDETELFIVPLLADHPEVALSLALALGEPTPGPATARFLLDLLHAADLHAELALISAATGEHPVFSLFGHGVTDRTTRC